VKAQTAETKNNLKAFNEMLKPKPKPQSLKTF